MVKRVRSTGRQAKAKSGKKRSSSPRAAQKKKRGTTVSKPRAKKRAKNVAKKKKLKPARAKKASVAAKKKSPKKKAARKTKVTKKRHTPATAKAKTASKGKKKVSKKRAARPSPSSRVKIFDQASKLFNRHDFRKARQAFRSFIKQFPEETEMVAHARTYIAICQRQLRKSPRLPRDAESLYDRGIIQLNKGRLSESVSYFEKALKYESNAPDILYSLAAAQARLGNLEEALSALRGAIEQREVLRVHARRDADFTSLHWNPEFQELVGWEMVEDTIPMPRRAELPPES